MMRVRKNIVFLAAPMLVLIPVAAQAQLSDSPEANLVDQFQSVAGSWATNIRPSLRRLFFLLVSLDFAWVSIQLLLRQSTLDSWAGNIVRKILFYGFGLALLENGSDWAEAIIDSLVRLANIADAGPGFTSESMFEQCIDVLATMGNNMDVWDLGLALFLGLAAIAVVLIFAFMMFVLVVAYAEAYIVLGAGTVVLALAGSDWTKDYAHKYLHYALLVGVRLFITILLAKLGGALMIGWADGLKTGELADVGKSLISIAVFAMLFQRIPSAFVGMLSGAGPTDSSGLISGTMTAVGTAAMTQASGIGRAIHSAAGMSRATAPALTGMARAADTTRHLGTAIREDVSSAFGGGDRIHESGQVMPFRVSDRILDKLDELQRESKPGMEVGAAQPRESGRPAVSPPPAQPPTK